MTERTLHGKFEGWEVGEDGILSHHGQTVFVMLDSNGGARNDVGMRYKLIDESKALVQAEEVPIPPFVIKEKIIIKAMEH